MASLKDSLAVLNLNLKPSSDFPKPIGFDAAAAAAASVAAVKDEGGAQTNVVTQTQASKILALKKKRAMEMALAPGKNIFLTMFMMWMTGGGVHIFSIMIVGMAVVQPIQALMSINTYFAPVEDSTGQLDLTEAKLMYVACCLAGLGVAMYKMNSMGLLPVTSADWISLLEPREQIELTGGGVVFS